MWFLTKDKSIKITDLVLEDNIGEYHGMISFTTVAKLYAHDGRIDTDFTSFDVCVENQTRMSDGKIKVDCVSKDVHDVLNSDTAGYNGNTTVERLFNKLGFAYKSQYQTNNTYFSIPQCTVITLFDKITRSASFANGGGAHFYMGNDGMIYGYDYKLIKEKQRSFRVDASVQSEQMKLDWLDYTPSEYDLFIWDENNAFKRERLTLVKGFGCATVDIVDTTGVWKNVAKQELTNMFFNKWYSSHTVNISVPTGVQIHVGDLIDLNGLGKTYIVKAVTTGFNELSKIPTVNALIISEPIFD